VIRTELEVEEYGGRGDGEGEGGRARADAILSTILEDVLLSETISAVFYNTSGRLLTQRRIGPNVQRVKSHVTSSVRGGVT